MVDTLSRRITDALLTLLARRPKSSLPIAADPKRAAQTLAGRAAKKAAAVSGGLALPVGPLGLLTVVPDLVVIWRLQQQLVVDIAAVYGRSDAVNQQTMIHCLFQHSSASIVKDLVARVGGRSLVRRASATLIRSVLKRIGLRLARLLLGKSVARLIPLVGAAAVAGYAYQDTIKVAASAIALFGRDLGEEPLPTPAR